VTLEAGSRLAKAIGHDTPTTGHCVHHQAIDRVAQGLSVVGRTDDGIVHACELDSASWIVATQWHPEDTAATDPDQQALFNALIEHC
jgi:putative glutamine amidotransferase